MLWHNRMLAPFTAGAGEGLTPRYDAALRRLSRLARSGISTSRSATEVASLKCRNGLASIVMLRCSRYPP